MNHISTSSCSQGFVEEPRGAQDPRRHRGDGHQRRESHQVHGHRDLGPGRQHGSRGRRWVGRLGWGNQGNWGKKWWKNGGKMRKMMDSWWKTEGKNYGKMTGHGGTMRFWPGNWWDDEWGPAATNQTVQPTVENLGLTFKNVPWWSVWWN